jgi:hypothetical protein
MTQGDHSSKQLIKLFGVLVGIATIATFLWGIYTYRSENIATREQLDNEAAQIALQETQVSYAANQVTLSAQQANLT